MIAVQGSDYAELDDKWIVDPGGGIYTSSAKSEQRLIFKQPSRDGSISADITVLESLPSEQGTEPRLASIVFRYQDRNNYYYAGIGGHQGRYFIAKMLNRQDQPLVIAGERVSIDKNVAYRMEARFVGNRLMLSHNGITQLSYLDNTFNSGPWGFHTWLTKASFERIVVDSVKPTCFVIMPFASEFDDIYKVICRTVEKRGFECIRADERYLSGPIIEDALDQIERAVLIVADFTGKNANVFYEAGYAKALRKPVVRIAQSVGDLPFDVQHLRTFPYTTKILGDRKLARDLGAAIKATTGFDRPTPSNGHTPD